MLIPLSLTGCQTSEDIIKAAAEEKARQDEALRLPNQPAECGKRVRSGVSQGDRLDVAVIKTDIALGSANARGGRCAEWYNTLKRQYDLIATGTEKSD
jgi:hypothetical protein